MALEHSKLFASVRAEGSADYLLDIDLHAVQQPTFGPVADEVLPGSPGKSRSSDPAGPGAVDASPVEGRREMA